MKSLITRLAALTLATLATLARPAAAQTEYRFSPVNQANIATAASYWNPIVAYVSEKAGVKLSLKLGRTSADTTAYVCSVEQLVMDVLAELVVISVLLIPAYATRTEARPPAGQALEVRVVAEQFAWNVHYPGADGRFGRTALDLVSADNPLGLDRHDPAATDDITTVNELHLPIGRPVIVLLSSKDVVHSFGLPQMRVKQDAVPGLAIPVQFTATKIGEYEVACAELCGMQHYKMRARLLVMSGPDFDKWLIAHAGAQ